MFIIPFVSVSVKPRVYRVPSYYFKFSIEIKKNIMKSDLYLSVTIIVSDC